MNESIRSERRFAEHPFLLIHEVCFTPNRKTRNKFENRRVESRMMQPSVQIFNSSLGMTQGQTTTDIIPDRRFLFLLVTEVLHIQVPDNDDDYSPLEQNGGARPGSVSTWTSPP